MFNTPVITAVFILGNKPFLSAVAVHLNPEINSKISAVLNQIPVWTVRDSAIIIAIK